MSDGRLRQARSAFAETARTPNLRRAQLSYGAAFTAEWMLTVALGILAFRNGGATAVGVVAMARLLPAALLTPLAAVIVDRHRRERVLVAIGLLRAGMLGAAALALSVTGAPGATYVLATLATLAHTLYRPAHSALLPSLATTPSQLTSANVVRGLQDSGSALVGPLAAGLLIGPVGIPGVLWASAAMALWSAWLIARVTYESPPRVVVAAPVHPVREAVEGFAVMRHRPGTRLLTGLICVQAWVRGCFTVFSVVVALELLDTGEAGVAVLTAAFGAGAVVGSFAASLLV